MQEIVVPVGIATTNLANFLKKSFPIGYIRKLFRKNGVRLNGRRGHPTDPIEASDRIQLYIPFESPNSKPARSLAPNDIEIIYEDESLLVLDKPAGLAVHEGRTVSRRDSLAGFIERKYREQKFRPLLAH